MRKSLNILIFLACSFCLPGQVEKDTVGRVTSSVHLSGKYHVAFSSEYGYSATDIDAGLVYAVRDGADIVEYEVTSSATANPLPGFNAVLEMSPLNGYAGTFPTSVAVIYSPQGGTGLSLIHI